MTRSGLLDEIGDDNVFGNIDDALDRARGQLGLPPRGHLAGALPTVARETGEHPVVRALVPTESARRPSPKLGRRGRRAGTRPDARRGRAETTRAPSARATRLERDSRARRRCAASATYGANEIAAHRPDRWPMRLVPRRAQPAGDPARGARGVSLATGDVRAAIVMALMVVLGVGAALRAGGAGRRGRGEAPGDDPRHGDRPARRPAARGAAARARARRRRAAVGRRHDPGRRAAPLRARTCSSSRRASPASRCRSRSSTPPERDGPSAPLELHEPLLPRHQRARAARRPPWSSQTGAADLPRHDGQQPRAASSRRPASTGRHAASPG